MLMFNVRWQRYVKKAIFLWAQFFVFSRQLFFIPNEFGMDSIYFSAVRLVHKFGTFLILNVILFPESVMNEYRTLRTSYNKKSFSFVFDVVFSSFICFCLKKLPLSNILFTNFGTHSNYLNKFSNCLRINIINYVG